MAYGFPQVPSAAPTRTPETAAEARRVTVFVNTLGAVLSVALVGGVGFWSYRLMVRDISGIPVIRALEGPMRVSPADPGGRQAAYQGLAVNSVVAADGTASRAPAVIALAPPPTDLAPEDWPTAATTPAPAPAPVVAPVAVEPAVQEPAARVPPGTPGVARSPVPPRRPMRRAAGTVAVATAAPPPAAAQSGVDRLAEAALQEVVARLSAPRTIDLDPASLPPGTRLVQFGAYESDAEARSAWADLAARFPAYLEGRARVVEPATAGGRVFYRLRAHGFRDEPEARRFCSVFLSENLECTPVLIR